LNAPFDPADRDGGGTDLNWEKNWRLEAEPKENGGSKLNQKEDAVGPLRTGSITCNSDGPPAAGFATPEKLSLPRPAALCTLSQHRQYIAGRATLTATHPQAVRATTTRAGESEAGGGPPAGFRLELCGRPRFYFEEERWEW
jgi:hypothetical protein